MKHTEYRLLLKVTWLCIFLSVLLHMALTWHLLSICLLGKVGAATQNDSIHHAPYEICQLDA